MSFDGVFYIKKWCAEEERFSQFSKFLDQAMKEQTSDLTVRKCLQTLWKITVKTKRAQPTKYGKKKKVRTDRHTEKKRKKRPFTH